LADARAVVRRSFEMTTYLPDAQQKAVWDEAYGRFLGLSSER
jgi:hypothetical protein